MDQTDKEQRDQYPAVIENARNSGMPHPIVTKLPFTIMDECPKCGQLSVSPASYEDNTWYVNDSRTVGMSCAVCNHYWELDVELMMQFRATRLPIKSGA